MTSDYVTNFSNHVHGMGWGQLATTLQLFVVSFWMKFHFWNTSLQLHDLLDDVPTTLLTFRTHTFFRASSEEKDICLFFSDPPLVPPMTMTRLAVVKRDPIFWRPLFERRSETRWQLVNSCRHSGKHISSKKTWCVQRFAKNIQLLAKLDDQSLWNPIDIPSNSH